MCLITNQKESKIAEEDMTVYKVLRIDGKSHVQGFPYVPGGLHKTTIEQSDQWCAADETALDVLNEDFDRWRNGNNKSLVCFGQGFHSCRTRERAVRLNETSDERGEIKEFVIPKGATYYEDMTDLLISDQIIMK